MGHRQELTLVKIENISNSDEKPKTTKAKNSRNFKAGCGQI